MLGGLGFIGTGRSAPGQAGASDYLRQFQPNVTRIPMTIRNQFSLIAVTALLIGIAVIFFNRYRGHEEKVFIYAVPFKTEFGWGYTLPEYFG